PLLTSRQGIILLVSISSVLLIITRQNCSGYEVPHRCSFPDGTDRQTHFPVPQTHGSARHTPFWLSQCFHPAPSGNTNAQNTHKDSSPGPGTASHPRTAPDSSIPCAGSSCPLLPEYAKSSLSGFPVRI